MFRLLALNSITVAKSGDLHALIIDVKKLEQIQSRATKFILGTSHPHPDYKHRWIILNLLPHMYYFEIADIMFMVKSIKKNELSFQHSEVC